MISIMSALSLQGCIESDSNSDKSEQQETYDTVLAQYSMDGLYRGCLEVKGNTVRVSDSSGNYLYTSTNQTNGLSIDSTSPDGTVTKVHRIRSYADGSHLAVLSRNGALLDSNPVRYRKKISSCAAATSQMTFSTDYIAIYGANDGNLDACLTTTPGNGGTWSVVRVDGSTISGTTAWNPESATVNYSDGSIKTYTRTSGFYSDNSFYVSVDTNQQYRMLVDSCDIGSIPSTVTLPN